MTLKTYLIAHTDRKGKNAAQVKISAKGVGKARAAFTENYPEREIVAVGELGKESM